MRGDIELMGGPPKSPPLGKTLVNRGHVKWPPLPTMVDHGQATMVSSTFKNQMTMVTHGQMFDVQAFIINNLWGMNRLIHGQPWLNHGQRWLNHGQ